MPVAVLALYVILVGLAFGLRVVVQLRRTGSPGLNRFRGTPGSAQWWAGVLLVVEAAAAPLGPVLALLHVVEPIAALNTGTLHAIGLVLAVAGILLIVVAQLAMGDSWRIGVDEAERTDLVTGGFFAVVRNPIYAAFGPVTLGFLLMLPSPFMLVDTVLMGLAFELLVRTVEEPYLLRLHGDAYRSYASRVGRFLPGIGRLAPSEEKARLGPATPGASR